MSQIVDIHTHYSGRSKGGDPLGVGGAMRSVRVGRNMYSDYKGMPNLAHYELGDFQLQQEVSHRAGITYRLMSNPFPSEVLSEISPRSSIDVCKHFNDEIAEIVATAPNDTRGLGSVNPLEKNHIREAERLMGPVGFKGLHLVTSWHGAFLDDEAAFAFWEYAQDKNVPIFLHPPRVPIGANQQMDQYKLDELVGRPFDTTMCAARMILSGLFDRFPRLQICLAHMGGGLLPCIGRLDFGWQLGCEGMPERAAIKCKNLPSTYLRRNLHVDIMGGWAPHVREAIEVFGPDRVMFGTDYGPIPVDPKEHVEIVRAMGLSPDDEEKIFWKNADAFFDLGLSTRLRPS
jgi:predicted TIM-barrel fold metal-dependent hydrolase